MYIANKNTKNSKYQFVKINLKCKNDLNSDEFAFNDIPRATQLTKLTKNETQNSIRDHSGR